LIRAAQLWCEALHEKQGLSIASPIQIAFPRCSNKRRSFILHFEDDFFLGRHLAVTTALNLLGIFILDRSLASGLIRNGCP
jgi:hypothetical protein